MIETMLAGMVGKVDTTIFSPRIIEFINGSAFIVHLSMTWYFGRYVVQRFIDYGLSRETYHTIDGSLAVSILSVGCMFVRGSFWALRFLQNHNVDTEKFASWLALGALVGAFITIAGGICAVRVFARQSEQPWPWVLTGVAAAAFGGMAFLPF